MLVVSAGQDVFYLVKLLCDFKDEDDEVAEKREEDHKEDAIVMYNEIVDVLKLVHAVYANYDSERSQILGPLEGFKREGTAKKSIRKRGFVISKALLIEAWSMCRPRTSKDKETFRRANLTDLQYDMISARKLFGSDYLQRLVNDTKIKTYLSGGAKD